MSHTLQSLFDLRHKIEKLISSEADISEHIEETIDSLNVLLHFPITSDLITQSGLGNVIASVRDKFQKIHGAEAVLELSKQILINWKNIKRANKIIGDHAAQSQQKGEEVPTEMSHHSTPVERKKLILNESSKGFFVTATKQFSLEDSQLIEKRKTALSQTRRNIVSIFVNIFKSTVGQLKAEKIGLDIEEHINNVSNHDTANKDYIAKAKMLSANIKMNKNLKEEIEKNEIDFQRLISLSARELAAPEVKLRREQLTEIAFDSRRLDWFQKHEKEIKEKLGLDPSNDWTYDNEDDRLSEPDAEPPDI